MAATNSKLKNWAGNITYSTNKVYAPASLHEVQQLVKQHPKLKALGTRHCFNAIADSTAVFLSTVHLNRLVSLDIKAHTVTIEGGVRYGDICPLLHEKGYALHNLASLPHIAVAGACATATHGSGVNNGNLATAVSALEFVAADGSVVNLSRSDGDAFEAAVVALGAIGIITKITLNLQPAFMMRQYVYEQMPLQQLKNHFDEVMSAGYSVSLFTNWQPGKVNNLSDTSKVSDRLFINEVWIKSCVDDDHNKEAKKDFFGAKPATQNLHPIAELPAVHCTEQLGVPGAWYQRLPHFKMGFTPSSGKELQSEYFIPRTHAVEAISAIARMGAQIAPHLFVSEIRTIDADNFWMSPCYRQPCIAIHFTWKQQWGAVKKLLPVIERELAPYQARPHWGKLFTMQPAILASLYEKMPAFKTIVAQYDPQGKFRNAFLEKYVYG